AFDLSQEQFDAVKAAYRQDKDRLRFSSGLHAVPRSGRVIGAHFAHRKGEGGNTEPETLHHINARRVIRDVGLELGWQVEIEARHPQGRWQADALLSKGRRRIAFEVQWSPQGVDQYECRT